MNDTDVPLGPRMALPRVGKRSLMTLDEVEELAAELLAVHHECGDASARKKSSGSSYKKGRGKGDGSPELTYAYALLKKYDKRGGMAKPAAYAAYLKLPANA